MTTLGAPACQPGLIFPEPFHIEETDHFTLRSTGGLRLHRSQHQPHHNRARLPDRLARTARMTGKFQICLARVQDGRKIGCIAQQNARRNLSLSALRFRRHAVRRLLRCTHSARRLLASRCGGVHKPLLPALVVSWMRSAVGRTTVAPNKLPCPRNRLLGSSPFRHPDSLL